MFDIRASMAENISMQLAKDKDKIIIDCLTEILGEDFMKISNLKDRLTFNYIKDVEFIYLDGEIILEFYPLISDCDGNVITYKQSYRRVK